MSKVITIKGVECYGTLTDESSILMAYTDDLGYPNEGIVENHNYNTDDFFKNWAEAVNYLIELDRFDDIQQLEVV
jgi:hypothetical protein